MWFVTYDMREVKATKSQEEQQSPGLLKLDWKVKL